MKKLLLCMWALLLLGCCQPALAAPARLPVCLDGVNLSAGGESAVFAQEQNGTAYVPLRFVAELFNAEVLWEAGQITVNVDENAIKMTIGSKEAAFNGRPAMLSGAPYEAAGVTYVPLRFFAEAFGCVVWYQDGMVSLAAEPLEIDGQVITELIYIDEGHVMGADYYTVSGNQLMRSLYNALQGSLDAETAVPAVKNITSPSVADDGDYIYNEAYVFKNAQGEVVYQLEVLNQLHRIPGQTGFSYTKLAHIEPNDTYFAFTDNLEAAIQRALLYKQFINSTAP